LPENEEFNNHVSMVRIWSEHAIGFLKGRFQSLKHLRVRILDERSHKFATYWVAACVTIHAFAMQCEDEERSDSNSDEDPFIAGGLSSSSESNISPPPRTRGPVSQQRLQAAKAQREKLKQALFRAKERRRQDQLQEEEDDTDEMDVVFDAE
jgi:DDE superfamily endonuclease